MPARHAIVLVAALLLGFANSCHAPVTAAAPYVSRDQSEAMEAVCRLQEAAWNRGDIEAFMSEGYVDSPSMTFFSGGDWTRGYRQVLDRYSRKYKGDGNEMGKLTFSDLETMPLDTNAGIVRGRWQLDFKNRESLAGLFTLVMRRTSIGWRIVHDHTSLATPR
jgi:ketosteroid isomerase-like protein